ncbi:MAG: four helix bundle protein [Candidatus Omnitrophota bacterium]
MKQAYEELKFYQNICEIRRLIYKITQKFDKKSFRLISQMRDAARSAKQNIIEGYKKDSAGEFGHGIKITRGSLGELAGDWDDCFEDGLINQQEYLKIKELIQKTMFQIDRYLDSLYKLDKEGKWKSRFKR